MPEMDAPRALVFRPLVKENEALGTRLRTFLLAIALKLQFVFRTMDPQREVDSCKLCGFMFLDKRKKRNIVGEFARIVETVVGVEIGSKKVRAL